MSVTQSTRKPILIAGAGLASLLFAQCLRRASVPFLIYERDSSISFRAQGYRLRLSSVGLDSVESSLDADHFQKFWDACGKTGGGGLRALNANTGDEIPETSEQQQKPDSASKPGSFPPEELRSRNGQIVGISRGDMRRIFMDGCESSVKWSHQVAGYEVTAGGVRLLFTDGSKSVEGDMLVGGEGIYSKVARQLSDGKIKVFDTGARGIHGQSPTSAFAGLGEGVWRIIDDSHPGGTVSLITNVRKSREDAPDKELGWTMGAHPGVIKAPNDDFTLLGEPAAVLAKSFAANWHPRFKPLFDDMASSEAAFWKITCSSPKGVPEWPNQPRVTVIGDAVHSMTPAGGNGANTAMRDSALLGRLIAEAGGYADGLTAAYEKEMRVYGSEAVKKSYGMAQHAFGITIDDDSPTV